MKISVWISDLEKILDALAAARDQLTAADTEASIKRLESVIRLSPLTQKVDKEVNRLSEMIGGDPSLLEAD